MYIYIYIKVKKLTFFSRRRFEVNLLQYIFVYNVVANVCDVTKL